MMNRVIELFSEEQTYQGRNYTTNETCFCGCGINLLELNNPEYYDYENNLEEE